MEVWDSAEEAVMSAPVEAPVGAVVEAPVDAVDSQMETVDAGVVTPAGGDTCDGDAGMPGFGRAAPTVAARAPTAKDAFEYNMNHKRRGRAVIFNHRDFHPDKQMKTRDGTDVDRDSLKKVLKDLDFDVEVHNNLTKSELLAELGKLSTMDHSDADCLVISFLSHGTTGKLHAYDEELESGHVWTPFTADKCPSLAGKPKIFFIQACQGGKMDGGTTLAHSQTDGIVHRRTATDGDVVSYEIPTHADFLQCFSTVPGYCSWRDPTQGSWFIQAIVACLRQYGRQLDLLTIMTQVNRRVATDFQSNCPDNPSMQQRKQIPCVSSMLTRNVFFPPKTPRQDSPQLSLSMPR